jgi:hypothetical protein
MPKALHGLSAASDSNMAIGIAIIGLLAFAGAAFTIATHAPHHRRRHR